MHYLSCLLPLDIFISKYKIIHSGLIYPHQEPGDVAHLVHLMYLIYYAQGPEFNFHSKVSPDVGHILFSIPDSDS